MKQNTTICIDQDVLAIIKLKYPNKMSSMINDYLKSLINNTFESDSKEISELKTEKISIKDEINTFLLEQNQKLVIIDSQLSILLSSQKEKDKKESLEFDEYVKKADEHIRLTKEEVFGDEVKIRRL